MELSENMQFFGGFLKNVKPVDWNCKKYAVFWSFFTECKTGKLELALRALVLREVFF